tara:strand:- start:4676 stop:5536 length:861 start_codon:yes stop_codon:yes gene_type:complete
MTNSIDYKGIEILNKDEPTFAKDTNVSICVYLINMKTSPFLEFLMYKNNNILEFPSFKYSGDNVINETRNILNIMLSNLNVKINYVGYIKEILFFEIKTEIEYGVFQKKDNKLWFILVYELINLQESLKIPISSNVVNLFLENTKLLYLTKNKNIIETPIVGFYGNHYDKITSVFLFGQHKGNVEDCLGPYYYYGDYDRAIKYSIRSFSNKLSVDKQKYKGGLVKFALFLGKTNMVTGKKINKEWIKDYQSLIYKKDNSIVYCISNKLNQYSLAHYRVNTNSMSIE